MSQTNSEGKVFMLQATHSCNFILVHVASIAISGVTFAGVVLTLFCLNWSLLLPHTQLKTYRNTVPDICETTNAKKKYDAYLSSNPK